MELGAESCSVEWASQFDNDNQVYSSNWIFLKQETSVLVEVDNFLHIQHRTYEQPLN